MARDPVCGMNVKEDRSNNLRSEYRGQSYYFCSDKCQKEFDRNPGKFARDRDDRDQNRDARNANDNRDDRRPR